MKTTCQWACRRHQRRFFGAGHSEGKIRYKANTRFRTNWSNDLELVEECYMLLLNKANRVTGIFHVSRGGITGTVVDVKIILVTALKSLASGIILAHNHPSGNLQPSQADVELTTRLRKACSVLDIAFLDHLILGMEGYYSFADEGGV